jgi:hypothetical protein
MGGVTDHLIRPRQHRRRDRQAQRLGSFQAHGQVELRRPLDRHVTGLRLLYPMRWTVPTGCASAASGATRRGGARVAKTAGRVSLMGLPMVADARRGGHSRGNAAMTLSRLGPWRQAGPLCPVPDPVPVRGVCGSTAPGVKISPQLHPPLAGGSGTRPPSQARFPPKSAVTVLHRDRRALADRPRRVHPAGEAREHQPGDVDA